MTFEQKDNVFDSNWLLRHYLSNRILRNNSASMLTLSERNDISKFVDFNNDKRCHSWFLYMWKRKIAECHNRNFSPFPSSSFSISSKIKVCETGNTSNIDYQSNSRCVPTSSNHQSDLLIQDYNFTQDTQSHDVKSSFFYCARKESASTKFSPLTSRGIVCVQDELEKKQSKIGGNISSMASEATSPSTCPVCLIALSKDKMEGNHLEFELKKLRKFTKTRFQTFQRKSITSVSLTTTQDVSKSGDGTNRDVEVEEGGRTLARVASSALRYKELSKVKRNRRYRLVEWRKTRRRGDMSDVITSIRKDIIGQAHNSFSVDPNRSSGMKDLDKKTNASEDDLVEENWITRSAREVTSRCEDHEDEENVDVEI